MPLWSEEFARCEKCDNPNFKIETFNLIRKGSLANAPIPMKIQKVWFCTNCGHGQYGLVEDVAE